MHLIVRARNHMTDSADTVSQRASRELTRLLDIMGQLRHREHGCPWDLEQTCASLAPHTIEEAYEVADAARRGAMDDLCDEVGDLLFQAVYYARIAQEDGHFDLADVLRRIGDKMVRRHPNVFGNKHTPDAQAQIEAWEQEKVAERRECHGENASRLDGIPLALPALMRAVKLSQRAARAGFEWHHLSEVWEKVREEEQELAHAQDRHQRDEEFGDLLFALVNVARWLDIDPEHALRQANDKFERRFRALETHLAERNITPEQSESTVMETIWQEIKHREGNTPDSPPATKRSQDHCQDH